MAQTARSKFPLKSRAEAGQNYLRAGAGLAGAALAAPLDRSPPLPFFSMTSLMMAAVAADPERGRELVVPEVRAALGARIRVLDVCQGRSVLVLDLDVDPGLGHW